MSDWDRVPPIKHDEYLFCTGRCRAYTLHQVTDYVDVSYRYCTRCRAHTTWTPQGKQLLETEHRDADPAKEDYDFKRNNPRKYRKRGSR